MIISVSRRCDIPRFHFEWLMERLDAGFTETMNPFNRTQVRRISLRPEDVDVLVFWTRDPRHIHAHLDALEKKGFRFYVMTTLTGYPQVLEPNMPPLEAVIQTMQKLAEALCPEQVIWRYDPIFFSTITTVDFHIRNFRFLSQALKGSVRRVIISLYDDYQRAKQRIAALEKAGAFKMLPFYNGTALLPELRALLTKLAALAHDAGMTIQACAETAELAPLGIKPGACIDRELIKGLWGIESGEKDKNQRPYCCCAPSVDIGSYGHCPGACVYCYARS
jgi:hypothetical protein